MRFPFMLHRTPYSSPPYVPDSYRSTLGPSASFAAEKFIFVYQDVRGKFRSEGDFVVMRPLQPSPKGPRVTDESTDTYDTIDWLVKNVPNNNGRVGQWGILSGLQRWRASDANLPQGVSPSAGDRPVPRDDSTTTARPVMYTSAGWRQRGRVTRSETRAGGRYARRTAIAFSGRAEGNGGDINEKSSIRVPT